MRRLEGGVTPPLESKVRWSRNKRIERLIENGPPRREHKRRTESKKRDKSLTVYRRIVRRRDVAWKDMSLAHIASVVGFYLTPQSQLRDFSRFMIQEGSLQVNIRRGGGGMKNERSRRKRDL